MGGEPSMIIRPASLWGPGRYFHRSHSTKISPDHADSTGRMSNHWLTTTWSCQKVSEWNSIVHMLAEFKGYLWTYTSNQQAHAGRGFCALSKPMPVPKPPFSFSTTVSFKVLDLWQCQGPVNSAVVNHCKSFWPVHVHSNICTCHFTGSMLEKLLDNKMINLPWVWGKCLKFPGPIGANKTSSWPRVHQVLCSAECHHCITPVILLTIDGTTKN